VSQSWAVEDRARDIIIQDVALRHAIATLSGQCQAGSLLGGEGIATALIFGADTTIAGSQGHKNTSTVV
jgi:hypothetical protein